MLLFVVFLFVLFLLMGMPIAYSMLISTTVGMMFVPNVSLVTVAQRMVIGLNFNWIDFNLINMDKYQSNFKK